MTALDLVRLTRQYSEARRELTAELEAQWAALFAELVAAEPNVERIADLEFELLGDCEIIGAMCPED